MPLRSTVLPVKNIIPGNNDRKSFKNLDELAASIKENGLVQPITVRPVHFCPTCGHRQLERFSHDHGTVKAVYEIVAGERRFRAISQVLQMKAIPCLVGDLADEEASAVMLVENTGREDLLPIEEAKAYQARIERFGWSIEKVAETAGVSSDLVKRRLSLLKLVEEVQLLVNSGQLPLGHAEAMSILDTNRQRIAVRIFSAGNNISLNHFSHIVNELYQEQCQDSLFDLETFWVKQVEEENIPRRGKHAFVDVPTREDLPPVTMMSKGNSVAALIDRYIATLEEQGLHDEAATVGTLYKGLVHLNYLSVPLSSTHDE